MNRASALLLMVAASASAAPDGVERFRSPFGEIYVVDRGPERFLRFGAAEGADQSAIVRGAPRAAPVEYVRATTLGAAFAQPMDHAVVVGLGAGVLSRAILRARPNIRLDSVELNPVVVELARARFELRHDPRHFVHVGDGAAFIAGMHERPDLIVLDAYQGDDLPEALSDRAFFTLALGRLSPRGVVVLNLAVEDDRLEHKITRRFITAAAWCRGLRVKEGNLVLFGGRARAIDAVRARAQAIDDDDGVGWPLAPFADQLRPCEAALRSAP